MRRFLSAVLAAALLLPVLALNLAPEARALTYVGSAQYRAGKYYDRLVAVELTGDQRTDIVNIARSQIGYQEGNSTNQLGGEVMGSTNFTEYGQWYGAQDMWCAMFVSWCANLAGVSQSVIPTHAFTPNGLQHFRERDLDYSPEQIMDGEYTPRSGDLIYFKNGRNANRTNHVGLVTGYADGKIYTIEGNVGSAAHTTNDGMVTEKSYPITNDFIVAVCSPRYTVGGTDVAEQELDSLRDAIYALESGGRYDCVTNAYGAVTLGAGQWYGDAALALLLEIRDADPESFAALDTAGIAESLTSESWNGWQPGEAQLACLSAILSSKTGKACQDNRMERHIEDHLAKADDLGVTDPEAALLCAGLIHLSGEAAAAAVLSGLEGEITAEVLCGADPICGLLSRYL